MEFVQGIGLDHMWFDLGEKDIVSAGGSLYYTEDLEKVAKGLGILLEDKRFCVGPDTRLPLRYRTGST